MYINIYTVLTSQTHIQVPSCSKGFRRNCDRNELLILNKLNHSVEQVQSCLRILNVCVKKNVLIKKI